MFHRRVWPALVFMAAIASVAAEEVPLWEAGVGVGAVSVPDYRGSDERRAYVLPIPYFIYRGDYLRVDRRGIRSEIFETARASLNISANLGPPADSDENEARVGMSDLSPTVEIGPSLNVRLHENLARDRLWSLRLPVRAAIATDLSHAEYIGVVFLPHVALDVRNLGPSGGWNLGLSAGPIFASHAYHDYFYAVPPEFATPTRPAFDARGGYSGMSAGLTISKRYPKYWMGGFVRYDNLNGAVFDDSPLVRTEHSFMAGIAVSRIFAQSKRRVIEPEDVNGYP